jgi:hypothetical protein
MSSSPTAEQLLCLLDEQLDRADEHRLVVHVETCERCQGRLDELVRNRLPSPLWLPSSLVEIAAQSGRAPRSSRIEESPGVSDPDAPPDVTVDLARIAELPTASDPTPIEPDHAGCSQEPTDVDVAKAPERAATAPPSPLWGAGGHRPGEGIWGEGSRRPGERMKLSALAE